MVVPIVVVPVFADVITNMTCHGSRSPQEPDVLCAHLRVNTKLSGGRVNCALLLGAFRLSFHMYVF